MGEPEDGILSGIFEPPLRTCMWHGFCACAQQRLHDWYGHLDRATFLHLMHLGLLRPRRFFDVLMEAEEAPIPTRPETEEFVGVSLPLLLRAGDDAAIEMNESFRKFSNLLKLPNLLRFFKFCV